MVVSDPRHLATVARLARAGCVAAAAEAAELLAGEPGDATLEAWLCRREQGEPLAWITGSIRFCGRVIHVAPGVYVPRTQTEELARRAADRLPPGGWALDLCTGAGAVAAHLQAEVPTAAVIATDLDAHAAACARGNGVRCLVADLASAVHPDHAFDVVTAVAPYVPTPAIGLLPADVQRYEPRRALDGGVDGLDLLRRVIVAAGELLRPGGWLLIEAGGEQGEALLPALRGAGFEPAPWWDEEGDLRGIEAQSAVVVGRA